MTHMTMLSLIDAGLTPSPDNNLGIIGGQTVPIESHPYQVSLEAKGSYCSGAIIAENYVLTSAICAITIPKGFVKIRAGTSTREKGGTVHSVESIHPHNHFNPAKLENNIALMRVKEPFIFDEFHQPASMYQSSETLDNGVHGNVTGWGWDKHLKSTHELQMVNVPVVDKMTCKLLYKTAKLAVPEGVACAGNAVPGKGSPCLGDWGAPFVVDGRLAGIVSFTAGCGLIVLPAWYTEISQYRDWIDSVIR
ncbi:hypothetical protein QAD02_023438 [Eretmocerus hayati]|uniref:Uncharacterized protein n=1 Tax=Eretmocerus hayati TaxID=131215 RepID=A0ACC2PWI7_9HYME|nr:hypothetical protein QAD02_023438 [Eretmocerus hayati]